MLFITAFFIEFFTPFDSFQIYLTGPSPAFYTFLLDHLPEPYLAPFFGCHPFHFSL